MQKINRHISKSVLLSIVVVLVLASSIDLVFTLADELGGTGVDYTTANAIVYVLLITPTDIYQLLPYAALGGALIGLGILASNNELIVIQAAGVQTWRIVWSAMKPAILVMVASLLLGEFIAPPLEQAAQSGKALQLSGGAVIATAQGTWQKIGNEFIHINSIEPGGEKLYGVSRYRLDDTRQLVASSFAESAEYVRAAPNSYWRLDNVEETLLEDSRTSTQRYREVDWVINLSPELLAVLLVKPQRQSISGLYQFANYSENQGLESGVYYLAFWKKLLQPLSTAALVLLAISFVFGPLRDATMGFRIFIAISIGLIFTIIQRMLEPASLLYGFSPLIAVLTPIAICGMLGFLLLRRVR